MYTVQKIEDIGQFERLKETWNKLLSESAADCLFLTWDWLFTWWKHVASGRQLAILAVSCGKELVAIAPLTIRRSEPRGLIWLRWLEFMGAGAAGSDYLDVIVRRGQERAALSALARQLDQDRCMLALKDFNRNGCSALQLGTDLGQAGWRVSLDTTILCPFINLAGHSWDSYLATLSGNYRYNFRRELKLLSSRFDVRFEPATSESRRQEFFSIFVALRKMRWKERKNGMDTFSRDSILSFHEEFSRLALERGWLRLFVLWLDGKPAASLYGFTYGRRFYFFQSTFDPAYSKHSVGKIILGLAIKSAIEEGVQEYDMLRGEEPYKLHWSNGVHELGRMELYPPTVAGALCCGLVGAMRATRKAAKYILRDFLANRLADKLATSA